PVLPPPPDAIARAQATSGWRRLDLDIHARRARQPGGLRLDLSGIAKGHAVDRLAAVVAGHGIAHALVEIGGELVGRGVRPDGQPWWVAVEAPPGSALAPVPLAPIHVALHGLAIATSGDYRRYFDHAGRRYAHSLDPRTGRPVKNDIASVTVLHAECMMADALATALLVMGVAGGMAFAARGDIAALFVTREGDGFAEHVTPSFAAMLD
ncbi:FAD:protein FMN transferase, partial [Sphingomonas solaris]